ncbi:uncharacterized protein ACN427_000122 isoform 1-T2 [Glossina fuscipes fuscipes]
MASISGTDRKTETTTTTSAILLATSTSSTSTSSTSSTQPCNSLAFDVEKQNSNSLPSPATEVTTAAIAAATIHHFIAVDSIKDSKRKPQMEIEEEELLDAVTFPVDEIPEPIKVLDDIISAFEDTSSRPQLQSSGENQSEDDGYMSLSRKNKRNSEEMSQASSNCIALATRNESFEADANELNGNCKKLDLRTITTINVHLDPSDLVQTTLPKARTMMAASSSSNNSNYSSLPCCGQRTTAMVSVGENKTRVGSCNGEKNALGIDISAVHKAVLRGSVAKLPEPMLNEHPITIYPGRCSPAKDNGSGGPGNRPKRLLASVEKHKEVCHILNPNSTSISSSSSSSSPATSDPTSDNRKTQSSSSQNTLDKSFHNSSEEEELSEDSVDGITVSSESTQLTPSGIAWEIHFKNFKKKAKQLKQEPYIKPTVKGKQGLSRLEKSTRKTCNDSHITMQMSQSTEEEFRNFEENAEILNSCVYRHSSMLGKGTFIIRRGSAKKLPKAMDIFCDYAVEKPGLSESEPDADSESEHALYSPHIANLETTKNLDIKEPTDRHSLGGVKPMTSPRDRLSLNIEPQHHQNSLKTDYSPVQYPNKETTGELTKAVKKCSIKSLEDLLSTELLNDMKISPTQEESSVGFDLQPKLTQAEASSLYVYKSATSGNPAGNDYNELRSSNTTTPRTDLAPTLEEDEEQLSDMSYSCGPLKQIESNISALLRGEMAVIRMADLINQPPSKRPLEFRPGVHKSESAKEMLLSQNAFGPLPPSPPSSNPDIFDYDDLPLPPSPGDDSSENDDIKSPMTPYIKTTAAEVHTRSMSREELRQPSTKEREKAKPVHRHMSDELPLPPPPTTFENLPPAVPPHRSAHSTNTMKSWSIDSNYRRKSPRVMGYGSGVTTPTSSHGPTYEGSGGGGYGTRRYVSYGTKRSLKQSPREEHRLQTSCSLPETPIFARGCDIPRTPYRRTPNEMTPIGSRTAPRSNTSNNINMGNSILGISGGNTYGGAMCRQRSINHALASNEMLRLSGAPQRGWYPKQRSLRPASTENIDRINTVRVWDGAAAMCGTGPSRKPLTLPPNLTPSFLNQSPREALRRVTSLLITKKKSSKEKRNKSVYSADHALDVTTSHYQDIDKVNTPKPKADSKRSQNSNNEKPKKKGIFKTLWKRTKHFSLDQ